MTEQKAAEQAAVVLRRIGTGANGEELYAYADRSPVVQPQQQKVHPYGAYIGVGIVGIAGVTALAFVAAILAVALSVGAVSLTICVVVLRSVLRELQQDRKAER